MLSIVNKTDSEARLMAAYLKTTVQNSFRHVYRHISYAALILKNQRIWIITPCMEICLPF